MRLPSVLLGLCALDCVSPALGCPWMQSGGAMPKDHPPVNVPTMKRGIKASDGKKGVFFHNRIAPVKQQLYIANSDGTSERSLLGKHSSNIDYHASFSADGNWIVFTSERIGDGNADLYRIRTDGTNLEELIATSSIEDSGVMSPDGSKLAYVSSANGYKANIWVMDLKTKEAYNLTDTAATKPNPNSPSGHFVS